MSWLKVFLQLLPVQQSQIIGISIFSGGCEEKIVYLDIKNEEGQDRFLVKAVFQTSKLASFAITGGEGDASISDKPPRSSEPCAYLAEVSAACR